MVLLNSNPATIMTDSDIADRVYIEHFSWMWSAGFCWRNPATAAGDAGGGQTGLNFAMELSSGFHGARHQAAGHRRGGYFQR